MKKLEEAKKKEREKEEVRVKEGEEEEEKVEKEKKKGREVETEKEEVKEVEEEKKEEREEEKVDEDKEEESPAVEVENLAVGQHGEQETCGAEGAGTWSVAGAEPGPPSEGLGPAKGTQELEDKTPGEVLEEGSCGEQRAGNSWGNAGESNIAPDSFTPWAVFQAGHLEASEELDGGAQVPLCPIADRESGNAPPGQCSKNRELGDVTLGHGQP